MYRTIDLNAIGVAPERIGEVLDWARALGYDALNITHPCKQLVIEHLDDVDDVAAAVGAVNTVVFDGAQRSAITRTQQVSRSGSPRACPAPPPTNVVMIGAGGAGAAVGDALLRLGTDHLTVVDADIERATALANDLSGRHQEARVDASESDKLPVLLPGSDGVVHCTPPAWPNTLACRSTPTCCTPGCGSPTSSTGRSTPRC